MRNDIHSARVKINYIMSELASVNGDIKSGNAKRAFDYTEKHIEAWIKILSIVNDKLGNI